MAPSALSGSPVIVERRRDRHAMPRRLPRAGADARLAAAAASPISSTIVFAKKDDAAETAGSLQPRVPPADRRAAGRRRPRHRRAAASEVLSRGGKDASVPWENPQTGARGTVTPIASAYTQDGFTCRDFLASYVERRRGLAAGRGLPAAPGQLGSARASGPGSAPEPHGVDAGPIRASAAIAVGDGPATTFSPHWRRWDCGLQETARLPMHVAVGALLPTLRAEGGRRPAHEVDLPGGIDDARPL